MDRFVLVFSAGRDTQWGKRVTLLMNPSDEEIAALGTDVRVVERPVDDPTLIPRIQDQMSDPIFAEAVRQIAQFAWDDGVDRIEI